jgi:hypothetical protein
MLENVTQQEVDQRFAGLALQIEEMEALDAPTWAEFFTGVGIGVGLVGLAVGAAALT